MNTEDNPMLSKSGRDIFIPQADVSAVTGNRYPGPAVKWNDTQLRELRVAPFFAAGSPEADVWSDIRVDVAVEYGIGDTPGWTERIALPVLGLIVRRACQTMRVWLEVGEASQQNPRDLVIRATIGTAQAGPMGHYSVNGQTSIAALGNADVDLPLFASSLVVSSSSANVDLQYLDSAGTATGVGTIVVNQPREYPIPRQAYQLRFVNQAAGVRVPVWGVRTQ